MERFALKYVFGSMALNGLSKTCEVWDARVKRYDYTQKSVNGYVENEMLLGEKFGIVIINTMMGPFKLPYTMIDNLNKVDIYMKGKNPEEYGYKRVKFVYDYYY